MSGFELAASLVEAMAWPAIILAALVVFRGPLGRLVDRTGEVEVPGGKWRESAQSTAASLATVTTDGEQAATPQLAGLASSDAGEAIERAYRKLATTLQAKLATATGEAPLSGTSLPDLAQRAVSAGVLSAETARSVEGMAVMRSLADIDPDRITTQQALEFIALADATAFAVVGDTGRRGALARRMRRSNPGQAET